MDDRSLGRGRVSGPAVGLGTWQRLEGAAAAGRDRELTGTAVTAGIRLFGTSPMFGDAERLLAGALDGRRGEAVIAGKIWPPSEQEGAAQPSRPGRQSWSARPGRHARHGRFPPRIPPRPYHNRRPHTPYRPQRSHVGTQRKRHSVSPLPAGRAGLRPHLRVSRSPASGMTSR
jgi:hypothetical protein